MVIKNQIHFKLYGYISKSTTIKNNTVYGGKQHSKNCKRKNNKNTKPRCTNCKEEHPDNYKGCIVAKIFQERRNLIEDKKK